MVLYKADKDAAAALAADDWNAATERVTVEVELGDETKKAIDGLLAQIDQESTEQPATETPGESDTSDPGADPQADITADDSPQDEDEETQQASEPAGGGGGEGATQNTSKQESSVAEPEAAAPGDNSDDAAGQPPQDSDSSASDPGGAGDEIDKHELGSRVAKILKQEKLTQKAFGDMAGVHHTSVSCLVRGVYVGPGDLKKIHAFVDSWDRGYDESKVEKLKTTWPDDPGVNKLPKHSPPPRLPGAR